MAKVLRLYSIIKNEDTCYYFFTLASMTTLWLDWNSPDGHSVAMLTA